MNCLIPEEYTTYVWWLLSQGLCIAGHSFTFALIDVGQNALLMHGSQLMFLSIAFFFECLNRSLKLHSHIKMYCTFKRERLSERFRHTSVFCFVLFLTWNDFGWSFLKLILIVKLQNDDWIYLIFVFQILVSKWWISISVSLKPRFLYIVSIFRFIYSALKAIFTSLIVIFGMQSYDTLNWVTNVVEMGIGVFRIGGRGGSKRIRSRSE